MYSSKYKICDHCPISFHILFVEINIVGGLTGSWWNKWNENNY